jgi:hypothetical protein
MEDKEYIKQLEVAYLNLMGMFDNPIIRRKANKYQIEALDQARKIKEEVQTRYSDKIEV